MTTSWPSPRRFPILKSLTIVAFLGAVPLLLLPGCELLPIYSSSARPAIRMKQSPPIEADSLMAPAAAATASGCPAINFQVAQQITDNNPNLGVLRQADGSFTEVTYKPNFINQTVAKANTVPNIQQNVINCSGLSARTRKVIAPNIKNDSLGTSARDPIAVDLAGDGAGAVVGYSDQVLANTILVQRANSDDTPRSSFVSYPIGIGPAGVLSADFNNDGKKDIAAVYTGASAAAFGPGGVSILLGNGDGTLKPAVNAISGANAISMTAFDFNGDGKVDLAVGHYGGVVRILLGNGDGTMTGGATYTMPSSEISVDTLAAADMNGDHIADLLVMTEGAVHILYGKGDGTFTTGPVIALAAGYGYIGTGDFNLDGITDFAVVAPNAAGVFIFMGTGAGGFAAPVEYSTSVASNGGLSSFYVEDFDGDGFPDIVFGAGHPDAVTSTYYGGLVAVLFGNGDGTFTSAPVARVDADGNYSQTPTPTNLVVADFNGDGKLDFATSSANSKTLAVALGTGPGAFKAPTTISMGSVQPTSIAAGVFATGGKPDLVVTDGVSNLYMLYHNGDGTFQLPVRYPTGGNNPSFAVTGDFNGDKKLDVAVVNAGSNNVAILPGFGDGSFNTALTTAVGLNPVGLIAGDFNGDGKLDLAVANGGTFSASGTNLGSVSVLLGKGDGTFQTAVNYPAYQYPVFISAADVNGDGKLDLIVASKGANGTDQIAMLAGNGNGTFQNAVLNATSSGPTSIAAADFSGDGKVDLAVAHCCSSSTIATMVGNGDGTFQAEVSLGQGAYFSAAAADFNGDGKPELAVTSYAAEWGRSVTVFRNISISQGALVITNAAGNPLKAPPVAAYSIATAKGTDLATGVLPNSSANPPTTLLGTTVTVQDSAGKSQSAQLFYVSPGQVNFLIPQSTATGNATVTITSGDGYVSTGTVAVTAIAPAIFTLNANSLAAAYVQRVHGDGTQSIEYLYAVDAAGNVTFPPIDLGPATDQVYLNIYGTGIQGRSALSAVTTTVGGASVSALYAGASGYAGEDQVVILLPRSLVGAGTVNVSMSVNGNAANTVTLSIK